MNKPLISIGTEVKYLDRVLNVVKIYRDATNRVRVELKDQTTGQSVTIDGKIMEDLI